MWTSLPLPIRLSALGLTATVLLVGAAVAVRTPPHLALEEDAPAPTTSASTRVTPSATAPVVRASADRPGPGLAVTAAAPGSTPRPPPAPAAPVPAGAAEARAALRKELQFGRYAAAAQAFTRLLEIDPRAAEDGEVHVDIVELSQRIMLLTGDEPARVFDLITQKTGTAGIDILYELVTTRGGSRAAARADELLRDEKIRALGTPALRVAYDLRNARDCEQKKALFPRAKAEGDGRTLGQLQLLNRRCGRHASACCLQNDPDLRETMDGMKARLER